MTTYNDPHIMVTMTVTMTVTMRVTEMYASVTLVSHSIKNIHLYLSSPFLSCMGKYITTVLFSWDLGLKKPNSLLLAVIMI